MATEASPGILTLPLELYICIFQSLYPPDLLSLGQTCKGIRSVVCQRHIWEFALRVTCRLNQLFAPSYHPLQGLDLADLRRAALEPWSRCTRFAQRSCEGLASNPSASRIESILLNGARNGGTDGERFEEVCIVPGGRYVFGMTRTRVCLWDLGQTGKTPTISCEPREPVNVMHAELGMTLWSMSAPTHISTSTFRFATVEDWSFHVYEVGPLPHNVEIRQIARLRDLAPTLAVDEFWIQGDRVMCHLTEGTVIWDYVKSEYVAIPTRGTASMMNTIGNHIMAWENLSSGVWTIPPLHPLLPCSSQELPELLSDDFTNGIDMGTIEDTEDKSLWPTSRIRLPSGWYVQPPNALDQPTVPTC
ncbi:hypothetical protein DFP72DRAFT_1130398 [Ephemerocybe angulata]|uniref:F-box domain-containing protein n=1 Tax=Ephemerocybe angulata TaxID=980116 RepID=A0A8H6IF68_9AGAR|nr:hypothetical protein DFP72DRAFT_1130398 [Tulosesus angulatus]